MTSLGDRNPVGERTRCGTIHVRVDDVDRPDIATETIPFLTRDESRNVWPLALISMGESWHNLHHADPTAARHGVDRWQFDTSAELIDRKSVV